MVKIVRHRRDPEALGEDERRAQLAELEARKLELQHEEEALIELAAADGTDIARRRDADPRAVLSITGPELG